VTARIVVVGGGSTHWTPRIVVDCANTPSLRDAALVLHDPDRVAAARMQALGRHVAKQRDIGMTVDATASLAEALEGADVVVSSFSVGGLDSMRHDLEVPARHGIRQPVGDSVGPGGISRALRTIPVILDVARAMERHCPDALLVNVSNPLSALCRAVQRETRVRTVGLCNEVVGGQFVLSLLLDADLRSIDPVIAGVNHLPLVVALRIGDDDGFALLRERLARIDEIGDEPLWMDPPPGMHWHRPDPDARWCKRDVVRNARLRFELFERFGVLPGSSDTHVAEFFAGFVTPESDWGRAWGAHEYGIEGHRADKAGDDAEAAAVVASDEISRLPSGELVAPLLDGLLSGTARTLPVNLPNTGQVEGLPTGAVVECMGVASAAGVKARDVARVPGWLGEQLRRVVASQELTVDAAITGDRTTVLEAMLTDPMAGSRPYDSVVAMTDELLHATAPWLPQARS
jgi:alpha-galactosidase